MRERSPSAFSVAFRLALCLGPAAIAAWALRSPEMQSVENRFYDARARWRAADIAPFEDLVIVAIDDASLSRFAGRYGGWPWPSDAYAELVDFCAAARVIALDVPPAEIRPAEKRMRDPLAESATRHGHVVAGLSRGRAGAHEVEDLGRSAIAHEGGIVSLMPDSAMEQPYPALRDAAARLGVVHLDPDPDGVVRSHTLVARNGDLLLPSLPLAVVLERLRLTTNEVAMAQDGTLRVGFRSWPLTADGRYYLAPTPGRYPHYSAADLLEASRAEERNRKPAVDRAVFAGRIVLIGPTADAALTRRVDTPYGTRRPAVELAANVVDNLLHRHFLHPSPAWLAALLTMLLGLAPALIPSDRPQVVYIGALALYASYSVAMLVVLGAGRTLLPMAGPGFALLLATFVLASVNWYGERARRRRIEDIDRAKQVFTDMLVHDLKGRAGTINMSVSLLQRRIPAEDDKIQRILHTVRSATARLLVETSTLLDIRKMQEGKMPVQPAEISLLGLIEERMAELRYAAELCHVTLKLPESGDLHLAADPELFGRVISNLLWNAIQYARSGSAVEIEYEVDTERHLYLHVSNRGEPVPLREQELLFNPFVTVARQRREGHGHSSGLGLTFCKLVAEAHGGRVEMESPWRAHGDGVRLTVVLPLRGPSHP